MSEPRDHRRDTFLKVLEEERKLQSIIDQIDELREEQKTQEAILRGCRADAKEWMERDKIYTVVVDLPIPHPQVPKQVLIVNRCASYGTITTNVVEVTK